MARRSGGSHVAPSTRSGPEMQYVEENIFDWLRRQQNPPKPNTPAVQAMAAAAAKKKDPEAGQGVEVQIPEGTN